MDPVSSPLPDQRSFRFHLTCHGVSRRNSSNIAAVSRASAARSLSFIAVAVFLALLPNTLSAAPRAPALRASNLALDLLNWVDQDRCQTAKTAQHSEALAQRPEDRSQRSPWVERETWILEALEKGNVLNLEPVGHGITRPFKAAIEHDDQRIHAIWKPLDSANFQEHESYQAEVVAYRLSRYLGLDMVPPTIERKIGRRYGSLQFWVDDYQMFSKVMDTRPSAFFASDQHQLMAFLDVLIDNPDRNAGNYLVSKDWQIVLIDHSRALNYNVRGRQRDAPAPSRFRPDVVEHLRSLDETALRELVGDLLVRSQLRRLHEDARDLVRSVEQEEALRGDHIYFDAPPGLLRPKALTQTTQRLP